MKTKLLRQSVTIYASPHDVYEALMDSKKHTKFTGQKAVVSRKVGGKFVVYGGLSGVNLELAPDKKIVQSWRCEMEDWPKGHHSKITFSLKKVKGGTRLSFTQSGLPVKSYKPMQQGWKQYYWEPMKAMLEK